MDRWRCCTVCVVLLLSGWYKNDAKDQVNIKSGFTQQILYSEIPKTTVQYGGTAQFTLHSNFSATPHMFMSFILDVGGETVATGAKNSISVEPTNKVFGSRLVGHKMGRSNEYRLFVSEANYEDNVVIHVTVILKEGSQTVTELTAVRSNITLEVVGGPAVCRDSMGGPAVGELQPETDVYVNISQPTDIETLICGYPKPQVTWTLGDETLTDVTSELVVKDPEDGRRRRRSTHTTYKGRYRFRVRLPMVTPSMCGKNLKVTSEGNNRVPFSSETKLNVKFNPSTVIKTSYRINSSCVHVEWEPIEIGLCSGLEYEIRFSNKTGFPITSSTFPHPNTSHVLCFGDVTGENSTQVQAQAHFDGVAGGWSGSTFVLLEKPGPRPIIETGQSIQNDGVHEDWEAIVGGVVGGFLLILLIILIIYCCCCGCCVGWCAAFCVCSPCCKKDKKEEKYGVENSHSLSYQHKKNSKKKTKNIKVDLKNDTHNMNNTFAPVVLAGETPDYGETKNGKSPTAIYGQVQKPNSTLPKSEATTTDMEFFDPTEFDMEAEQQPTTLQSTYTNTTYDYGEDDDIDNKPSFLI